jgi:hypothetical protein
MSWKTHYLKVCEINAWPNIRRVREARAAMAEKAAWHTANVFPVYVADLAANPPVQITTWQDLIARYQEKFMLAAAGVYSRSEYNIAKQISSEDVGGWHARLGNLYNRAYLGEEVNNNLPLIEKFVTQLINKEVGKFVFERDPTTFAGALAKTKNATDVTFKTASRAGIHAFANPCPQWPTTGLITREKEEVADEKGVEEAAVAAPRGEKENQASAGSVTPPPTRSLPARSGIKH